MSDTKSDTKEITRSNAQRHLRRLIDEQIAHRSDAMYLSRYYDVEHFGRKAAGIFDKTQMNGLERIALNASNYSEIANYIKSQMGRSTSIGEKWREGGFGADLYQKLSRNVIGTVESNTGDVMEALRNPVVDALAYASESRKQAKDRVEEEVEHQLRVGYAQAYISHVVAHFNYENSIHQ